METLPQNLLPPVFLKLRGQFRRPFLLDQSLTHHSGRDVKGQLHPDNRDLEFLGRPLFEAAISQCLVHRLPDWQADKLLSVRTMLMSRTQLADLARALELGEVLRLGEAEALAGAHDWDELLAQAIVAVVGAVYLDQQAADAPSNPAEQDLVQEAWSTATLESAGQGWKAVMTFVLDQYQSALKTPELWLERPNPKGELLERLAAGGLAQVSFRELRTWGPDHARTFQIGVYWHGIQIAQGQAGTKRLAEAEGCRKALRRLKRGEWPEMPEEEHSSDPLAPPKVQGMPQAFGGPRVTPTSGTASKPPPGPASPPPSQPSSRRFEPAQNFQRLKPSPVRSFQLSAQNFDRYLIPAELQAKMQELEHRQRMRAQQEFRQAPGREPERRPDFDAEFDPEGFIDTEYEAELEGNSAAGAGITRDSHLRELSNARNRHQDPPLDSEEDSPFDAELDALLERTERRMDPHWSKMSETNPKGVLTEMAQKHGTPMPEFRLLDSTGPAHAPTFRVALFVGGQWCAEGRARTRKQAEQEAARAHVQLQLGAPQLGTPQLGTPQLGTPQLGTPQLGTPQLGTPHAGVRISGTSMPEMHRLGADTEPTRWEGGDD